MKDLTALLHLPPAQQEVYFEGPALQPPPGVRPNFTDPPNQNAMGLGVLILCTSIVVLLVTIQLYTRIFYRRKFAIVDGVTVAALGVYGAFIYCFCSVLLHPGLFVHQWDIRLKDLPHLLYILNTGSSEYGIIIMLLKVGILLQWVEIFVRAGGRDYFWWTCHITIWVNVIFYVICTFLEIFGCSPRQRMWTPWVEGTCIDTAKLIISASFVNLLSDIVILLLPQVVVWKLHMSAEKKCRTGALFAVGIFAIVCAGLRTNASFTFKNGTDIIYAMSTLGFWSLGEMTAGFLVLCLPALPKFFKSSSWVQTVVTALRSSFGASSAGSSDKHTSDRNHGWPRSKPKRDPDASLFTDTHLSHRSFVPLKDVSSSVLERQESEPRTQDV
ncbi:hypothetical protein EJ04DRAFT_582595 [Polyplosphaeria fusca]|uniref:Rhodopsin domain-containing protein n=1 Tax=Polyplosphaeria fusca TaxID=682080 RepID=A0A9P4UV73_9PLEO|nr:hypothetical protein EJ04DRAFT_582595 [Polyplosphaeria fusca]